MSPLNFQGPSRAHRTLQNLKCFTDRLTLSPVNLIPGSFAVLRSLKRKENSSQGPRRRLEVRLCCHTRRYPKSGSGILTRFPFDKRWNLYVDPPGRIRGSPSHAFVTELPYLLGPTNPCPIAVHTEPFSTSVFKVLI
jgi:hypothetical protein